ncbi:MAG: 50S ribosomal protein L28 [Phycisphaerae bacterium]|nr:50S ribosomal protein L28 [Phycisphaerae bacterium]
MARKCPFTGKKTHSGRTYTHRGKAKYLGGVGVKTTGRTKRTFRANMQRVRAVVNGSVRKINVSTKALRDGFITKPPKRKYAYTAEQKQQDEAK